MDLCPSTTVVRARGRRFVVVDVAEHGECRTVRLSPCHADDAGIALLHPFDRLDVLPVANSPKRSGRRRVARACAAAVRAGYAAGETRAAVDARIQVLPYQLEPALAVLHGEATRILLADEVGLGKTVQAGLILSELRARQALRRALILTPAGLREQWCLELRERFQIDAATIDASELAALQRRLPPWVNPWTIPGVAIASIDLLKRHELLPQLEYVVWDAVIVDEAHHATRGTDRHAVASVACRRARIVVLITATPHSGDRIAFDDLLSLGVLSDSQPIRIFRRARQDVWCGAPMRRTRVVRIARSAPERELDKRLRAYTARVWRESGRRGDPKDGARLAMIVLRKRALSGPASLARSLARRLVALDACRTCGEGSQLSLDFQDSLGGELIDDDREPARELAAPGLADGDAERSALVALLERARAAIGFDSKGERLVSTVSAARESVIVFTEYRDTLEDLRRRFEGRARVVTLHGAMLPAARRDAIAAFERGAARVLLATDAAAEGLNLQRTCRWVVHHEVPWSPVRIEQRNGRVDRLGQTRRVHVWHLIAATTEEEQVLLRLARRSAMAARDLACGNEAVAQGVFDGSPLSFDESPRPRAVLSARADREATRVQLLRRLPPAETVGGGSPLRDRGASLGRGVTVVFRVTVVDGQGRTVANECTGVEGSTIETCTAAARQDAGRRARESVAVDRRRSRGAKLRAAALESVISVAGTAPIQASLFDARAVHLSAHREAERRRSLSELAQFPRSSGRYRVRISLVGALGRRRRR